MEDWCYTKVKVMTYNYTWAIENIELSSLINDALKSSIFPSDPKSDFKWCLRKQDDVIDLLMVACKKPKLKVEIELTVLDERRVKIMRTKCTKQSPNDLNGEFTVATVNLCKRLVNGQIFILCKIVTVTDTVNISGHTYLMRPDNIQPNYTEDFGNILQNEEFSDVTIIVDGKEFHAHKVILAARSPVFAVLLWRDMEEAQTNCVAINDMNHEVFKEMLNYIYTDKAPNLTKMPHALLTAADKYSLENLKLMCCDNLCSHLSVETAADTLILAELSHAKDLSAQARSFIHAHFSEVVKTGGWTGLVKNHPQLLELLKICSFE